MIFSIFHRIKLFSNHRKEFYSFLKQVIGFYPGNKRLYEIAFVHKSASTTDPMGNLINNERLEYLGDAILGAVVAEFLYKRYPQRGEGFLTQMRSKLVNRSFLSDLMKETGLHQFVQSKQYRKNAATSIDGDTLEALIGAIYLDKGFETARHVIVKRILNQFVDLTKVEELDNNYKSQLIEWGQKNKQEINFNTVEEEKPKNKNNIFVTSIEIDHEVIGRGYGISKKESQQNAAQEALKHLDPVIDLP
ncbi:MAG: ribonuclease III [Prolixibacteraceae bacterium]|nr:ribonuclease III [Prolixibacteraceae bacterium]